MGLAEYSLGRLVEGEAHLVEVLAVTGDAWVAERRAALVDALAGVEAKLGRLDVRSTPLHAHLRLEDRDVGTLPLERPVRVMPGTVTLVVTAPGFEPSVRTVEVVAGQLTQERFTLVPVSSIAEPVRAAGPHGRSTLTPAAPVQSPPTPPAPSSDSPLPLIGWVTAGGGALAGLGFGLGFYGQREAAMAAYNDDSQCLVGGATRQENCSQHLDRAQAAQAAEVTSFIVGGVLVAGGIALVLLGQRSNEEASSPTRASAQCAPMFGSALGATCEGRF